MGVTGEAMKYPQKGEGLQLAVPHSLEYEVRPADTMAVRLGLLFSVRRWLGGTLYRNVGFFFEREVAQVCLDALNEGVRDNEKD